MKIHLEKFHSKPLHWSSVGSWQFNKDTWAERYLAEIKEKPNAKMVYGNIVGEKLRKDPEFLPEVPRYKKMEKRITVKYDTLKMAGSIDSFCPETYGFYEYKTSSNESRWNQKSAEKHGQLLFYMALIWKKFKIKPEDIKCSLHYIPVEPYFESPIDTGSKYDIFDEANKPQVKMRMREGEQIEHFHVKHTSMEVLKFLKNIKKIYREMEEYALKYRPKI